MSTRCDLLRDVQISILLKSFLIKKQYHHLEKLAPLPFYFFFKSNNSKRINPISSIVAQILLLKEVRRKRRFKKDKKISRKSLTFIL